MVEVGVLQGEFCPELYTDLGVYIVILNPAWASASGHFKFQPTKNCPSPFCFSRPHNGARLVSGLQLRQHKSFFEFSL